MKKPPTSIVLGTLVLAALGAIGWGANAASPKSATSKASVAAAAPVDRDTGRLAAPALVEPEGDVVSLAFDMGGRVVDVHVKEGDRVEAGAVLAKLDDRIARAAVSKAEAAVAVAEARRDQAERGARTDEIRAARGDADAADAEATKRERDAARATKLRDANAIASAQVDAETSAAKSARAVADASAARLSLLRAGSRGEQRREAAAAVEAARADLEEATVRLAQTELRAPRAGVVIRRFVEPGEQVATLPPTTVVTIADLDHVRLRAEIDEADIGRVSAGTPVFATAEGLGDRRVRGHVAYVERQLGRKQIRVDDPRARVDTRVLEVVIALDEPAPLPLGLRVDTHFECP